MSVLTAILSGLPFLSKLFDRLFPDKTDERAEKRKAIYASQEFKWFMRILLFLVVYEIVLRTLEWLFPYLGLPSSILENLDFFKAALLFFADIGA